MRLLALRVWEWMLLWAITFGAQAASTGDRTRVGDEFFQKIQVVELKIEVSEAELGSLRTNSRTWVKATIYEGATKYSSVAIHLRGCGSFEPLDKDPSFSVKFNKYVPAQRFHGLTKISLNNRMRGRDYVTEYIGYERVRAAGLAAPRVNYARISLNGRLLGVYILVEGITKDFLGRNFSDSLGNLYEGETQDVDGQVQQDSGARPGDRADLDKLVKAVHEPNPEARMRRFEEVLDVNQFQSFMAVEILLVHNDGYCLRKNNYRLYNDPATGRFNFIPHGMDFLFGNPYTLVLPEMKGMVATSLLEIPGQTNAYKARIALLETNVLNLAGIRRRVEEISAVVRPVLEKDDPKLAAQQKQAAEFFIQRVAARVAVVREQIVQWEKEAKREENAKANSGK